jgi:uncharacterized protein (TIGR03435 family)
MNYFAWALSQMTDRPVIDETGLKGEYDFDLAYTHEPPDLPQGNAALGRIPNDQAAIDASGPTLFEALEKQLGLKLEAKKAPVDILVIDHAEKPSEN